MPEEKQLTSKKAKSPRKRLCLIKNPVKYRNNVINKAWSVVKKFLNEDNVDNSKQIIVATQLALKSMEVDSKKELQKLKGAQTLANSGYLVDALNRAQELNKNISDTPMSMIALNARNHLLMDKRGEDLPDSEYEKMDQTLLPKTNGPNKGKWVGVDRVLTLDRKEKRDEARRLAEKAKLVKENLLDGGSSVNEEKHDITGNEVCQEKSLESSNTDATNVPSVTDADAPPSDA